MDASPELSSPLALSPLASSPLAPSSSPPPPPSSPLRRSRFRGTLLAITFWFVALWFVAPSAQAQLRPITLLEAADVFLPAGRSAWNLQLGSSIVEKAAAEDGSNQSLLDHLYPDADGQIDGKIEYSHSWLTLRRHIGLGDRWNVILAATWRRQRLVQTLTLGEEPSTELQARAEAFDDSSSVAGAGDASLFSLHRTSYDDEFSLLIGYGLRAPLQKEPYLGANGLHPASPSAGANALLRINLYPLGTRWRVGLMAALDQGLETKVDTPTAEDVTLLPGRNSEVQMRSEWIGLRWQWGLGLDFIERRPDLIDDEAQEKAAQQTAILAQLAYGNLGRLETGPLRWPYLIEWQVRQPLLVQSARNETQITLALTLF